MQLINDANAVLSDPAKRADYDAALRRARNPVPVVRRGSVGARRKARPERRSRRASVIAPPWLRGSLTWLSDARVVLPLLAVIWLVVYLLMSGKLKG